MVLTCFVSIAFQVRLRLMQTAAVRERRRYQVERLRPVGLHQQVVGSESGERTNGRTQIHSAKSSSSNEYH